MPIIRAIATKDAVSTAVIATGNGTAWQLGPLTSTQLLYAGLHTTYVNPGSLLLVTLQSATSSAFTAPTTRVSFTSASGPGGQWAAPVAGVSTDSAYYRNAWTVSSGASSAVASFLGWMGIL